MVKSDSPHAPTIAHARDVAVSARSFLTVRPPPEEDQTPAWNQTDSVLRIARFRILNHQNFKYLSVEHGDLCGAQKNKHKRCLFVAHAHALPKVAVQKHRMLLRDCAPRARRNAHA